LNNDPSYQHEEVVITQPGTLKWGLFLTLSDTHKGYRHHLWVRDVSHEGLEADAEAFYWDGPIIPGSVYKEIHDRVDAHIDAYLLWRFDLQNRLPF
jgi:hypothetical protein